MASPSAAASDQREPDVSLVIDPRCEECALLAQTCGIPMSPGQVTMYPQRKGDVLVEMRPGHDGLPWYLCVRCWLEGMRLRPAPDRAGTGRVVVAELAPDPPPQPKRRGRSKSAS